MRICLLYECVIYMSVCYTNDVCSTNVSVLRECLLYESVIYMGVCYTNAV